MTDEELNAGLTALTAIIDVVGKLYPPVAAIAPALTFVLKEALAKFEADRKAGVIVPDGRGGWVSKAWRDDPRHALRQDGTFVE